MSKEHILGVLEVENLSFSEPWSHEAFEGEINNSLAHYCVCLEGCKVIGYGGLWYIIDEAHVTNIAIHPQYRQKNYGKALLNALMAKALILGAHAMTLEVRESNKSAKNLYSQAGFEPYGIRKNYYTNPQENALIMWKKL
jgi:ribosomal-protein-alanine N-acetyltransferase